MKKYVGLIILIVVLGWLALPQASTVPVQASNRDHNRAIAETGGLTIIYVKTNVVGGAGDGSSWANAFPTLQDALAAASSGDEIWVAKGVYYPDEGSGQTDNSRDSTFQLINNVEIYGGFVGNETTRTQRDWHANITLLSGDIDGNDSNKDANGMISVFSDTQGSNAYHVVTGSGTDSSALLDGLTINAGKADGSNPNDSGGGIYNDAGSPTFANVTITANSARAGGGVSNYNSSNLTCNNVTITANSASFGGGMYHYNSNNSTFNNVTITANSASFGGGMYHHYSNNYTLNNVTITANSASDSGGGMYHVYSNNIYMYNVTISANSAQAGGGMYNVYSSGGTLQNVTITANSAISGIGGGMANFFSGNFALHNVIIWNNEANNDTTLASASIFSDHSLGDSRPTISYSLIANSGGSSAWNDLGTDLGNNIDVDPQFVTDGDPSTRPPTEGDYRLQLDSPAIDAGNNDAVMSTTDLADNNRRYDVPSVPDTGNGSAPLVDMGAYEVTPEIKVLGLGISITDGVTTTNTADGTDFGPLLVGETMTHTFTISNTGSFTLTLSLPITLSNSTDFAISSPPASIIPPESRSTFEVTFSPSTTATLTSTLQIGSDDTDENPFTFDIQGSQTPSPIEIFLPLLSR